MQIGIFAKTFSRPTVEGVLDAVKAAGVEAVQFNLSCAGLSTLPTAIEPELADGIRLAAEARGVRLAAISGTFNMIHPDLAQRRRGLLGLESLAAACPRLGVPIITICSGTRDSEDMWRRHPSNDDPDAWEDLVDVLVQALRIATRHGVTLAVEPEVSNVIDSARRCRRLLDELGSPRLKVVIDPANLFHAGELPRMRAILDEAFDLLGGDIVLAHAKDLGRDGEAGNRAAGRGVLDYDRYLALLDKAGFGGTVVLHGLTEEEVPASVEFLRGKLAGRQA